MEKSSRVGLAFSTDPSTPSGQERVKLSIKKGKVVLSPFYYIHVVQNHELSSQYKRQATNIETYEVAFNLHKKVVD